MTDQPKDPFAYQLPQDKPNKKRDSQRKKQRAKQKKQEAKLQRVRRLSAQLKAAYIVERRMYESQRDGVESHYKPHTKYDGQVAASLEDSSTENLWMKAARRLDSLRIEPVEFIQRIFAALAGKVAAPPMPQELTSPRAMQLYHSGKEEARDDIEVAHRVQKEIARREVVLSQSDGMSMPDAVQEVIYDTSLPLSALFRFCLAWSMRDQPVSQGASLAELAERYREDAALQFVTHSEEYSRVWGEWLPSDFAEGAESLYAELIGE